MAGQAREEKLMRIAILLLNVPALWLGGQGMYSSYTDYQTSQANVNNAVETQGTITESRDIEVVSGRYFGQEERYVPRVVYEYAYRGRSYESASYFPGPDPVHEHARAQAIVNQYSAGDNVTVYVNENEPSRAYLAEREDMVVHYREQFFVGAVFAGLFCVVLGGYLYKQRK